MPTDLTHVFATSLTFAVSVPAAILLLRGLQRREQALGWASFTAHWASSFALFWLMLDYYEGIGDVLSFFREGQVLAAYLDVDPGNAWTNVLGTLVQMEMDFPFEVRGVGRSTGTMGALAGLLLHLTQSKWAAGGLMAMVSFSGKVALYRFFRAQLPAWAHRYAAVATLLLPSVVFWTSGLVKEAVATFGLGWAMFAIGRAKPVGWRAPGWLALALVNLWIVSLAKTYLLVPIAVSVALWAAWKPLTRGRPTSPLRLVAGVVLASLAVIVVGQLFPRYSVEQVGEEIADMQLRGARAGGGSYVDVGDPTAQSLPEQLLFAPVGLLSVLFRPVVFEVRTFSMAMNAMETTLLSILLARMLVRLRLRIWQVIRSHQMLVMCVGFVLVAGVGVGLSTTNLGTLSRYRVPLMPFYVLFVLVAGELVRRLRASTTPTVGPSAGRPSLGAPGRPKTEGEGRPAAAAVRAPGAGLSADKRPR